MSFIFSHKSSIKILAVFSCALFGSTVYGQNYELTAKYGERSLESGFVPDPLLIELIAGGGKGTGKLGSGCVGNIADAPDFELNFTSGSLPLYISVASDADTTLVINTPDGDWVCDDDSAGNLNPLVEFNNVDSGIYDIWVGSYEDDDFPSATLMISELSDASDESTSSTPSVSLSTLSVDGQVYNGALEHGDELYSDGAYIDRYAFDGVAGQEVVIDLRSDDFDSYLIVTGPDGEQFSNDDYEGSINRSLLSLLLDTSGEYTVLASSLYESEVGSYSLAIDTNIDSGTGIDANYSGSLASGDSQRSNGQFMDSYEFSGAPGRSVIVDLNSTAFDTYLILESPNGQIEENDDTDTTMHSRIETELTEFGTYRVHVSSYEGGETGSYRLGIEAGDRVSVSAQSNRDTVNVTLGQVYSGSLLNDDARSSADRYQDHYSFSANAGDSVRIELNSQDFDTFLSLRTPDGAEIENDDFEGSTERSVIEYQLPSDGRYSLTVSSYREAETGRYSMSVTTVTNGFGSGSDYQLMAGSNVYGVFVGISDYSELRQQDSGWGDLSYTADDAIIVRDALMSSSGLDPANAITLLDRDASIENVESAFREMGNKINEDDVFVFFYSGHGGQERRASGPNAADADGYDETLALSNGTITDDEISVLFDQINANVSLIILDSCFSGGFAKDIVSKPGRMGLFSSDEDVPSLVASKFRAGGYLSHFFREAIDGGRADIDRDESISAMELSQYLHVRYSAESASKSSSDFDTPDFGYQHLVADRGGVAHDTVLFNLR